MAQHTIQFKGWQMGTWFTVDETEIYDEESELKLLLQSSSGTKVRVRLDKGGLKVTKLTSIPFMGSERIPLPQIKNIYANPKFPLCFFCTSCRPDGYLMKIIMIRCSNQMCVTGIVNYYRTITYKKPVKLDTITETTQENVPANVPTMVVSAVKDENKVSTVQTNGKAVTNGDLSTDANGNDAEKITPPPKKVEVIEVHNPPENGTVTVIGNVIETKEPDIKVLTKEVEDIQKQTLKKHPATISRQEYIDAHEKVHRLTTELSKQGVRTADAPSRKPRHYSVIYTQMDRSQMDRSQMDRSQMKKPGNAMRMYQPNHDRYLLVNDEGKVVAIHRARAQTINTANIPRHSILRASKESEELKASTLPKKPKPVTETTADSTTDGVSAPISDKGDTVTTGSQEPIYAQVHKNRANGNVHTNGDVKVPVNNSDNGSYNHIKMVGTPPVPQRTVTFENWSAGVQKSDVQKRPSKKGQKPEVRPHSYHQVLRESSSLNMHVPKRIEHVYYNSGNLAYSWKLTEQYRPRVNSNTFRDNKHRVAVYTEAF